jgi:acetylglutamate kinase
MNHDNVGKLWEPEKTCIFHNTFAEDLELLHSERVDIVVVHDGVSQYC